MQSEIYEWHSIEAVVVQDTEYANRTAFGISVKLYMILQQQHIQM